MKLLDREDWIQEKADQIAESWYMKDFYELTEETRMTVFQRAEQEYADMWADRVDALYEAELDRRMEEIGEQHDE